MPEPTPEGRLPRFSRVSIGVKLPLITAGLILLVGGALATASYLTFKQTLREVAVERLEEISERMVAGYNTTMAASRISLTERGRHPALREYLDNPGPETTASALAVLREGATRSGIVARGLRNAQGEVLISTDSLAAKFKPLDPLRLVAAPGDSAIIGVLQVHNDSLLYPVVARIGGEVSGFLVEWHHISTSQELRKTIATVIGTGAGFHLGNADGSMWTDLSDLGPGPALEADTTATIQEYTRSSTAGPVLGAVTSVAGTPFVLTIEFPKRAIFAPAEAYLRQILLIAVACVSLGVLGAWWFSRQITRPLHLLTEDTQLLAATAGAVPVTGARGDELLQLRASFDRMAEQVVEGRQRLEEKVAVRTVDLHDALEQLQIAQESLVRREKLVLLGQLSSSIGHELRNPLGVMSNAIYYLESVQPDAPPEVRRYLGLLRNQVALSAKIVSDLLDFARGSQPDRQPTALQGLVEVPWNRVSAPAHIKLVTDLDANLPRVFADPVHVEQIMINLLTNAVQAIDEEPGTVRVGARRDGDRVCVEVSDTGPGIPSADLEKIFEPLFTTKARGIGLGLAVSRTLALANNAELTVVATSGPGATFALVLPIEPGA